MKKFKLLTCFFILIFVLSGCGTADNQIRESITTGRENALLSLAGDQTYMFEFTADATFTWVELYLEEYHYGELVVSSNTITTENKRQNNNLILASFRESEGSHYWNLMVAQGSEKTNLAFHIEPASELNWRISGSNPREELDIAENGLLLASLCFGEDSKASMNTLTDDFYQSPEENLHEIEDYAVTYLLRCSFLEEKPVNVETK